MRYSTSESTIACEVCGQDYKTVRKNTKYCRVCQLVRDLRFIEANLYDCVSCGRKFAPIVAQTKAFRICGNCDLMHSRHDCEGTCKLCGEESKTLLHEDVHICRKCSTDPERRERMYGGLVTTQRERKAQAPPSEEDDIPAI